MLSEVYMEKKCTFLTDTDDNSDNDYNTNGKWIENLRKRKHNEDSEDEYNYKKPKSFSKNALNARANRLKKKRYMENLEKEVSKLRDENGKLNSILDNQSFVITSLRKEVKYVKSVLANNSDITKLLKVINGNTGMPVTTSLNKNLTIINDFTLKNNQQISNSRYEQYFSSTSSKLENDDSLLLEDEMNFSNSLEANTLFSDYDIPLNNINSNVSLFDIANGNSKQALKEHNYTMSSEDNSNDSCGICLHVSNGKLSLEFCSICNENASKTWKEAE